MSRKQEIAIQISPTGVVSFTMKGVKGTACLDETRFLEDALGGEVLEQEKTSEYYEQGDAPSTVWTTAGEGDGDD